MKGKKGGKGKGEGATYYGSSPPSIDDDEYYWSYVEYGGKGKVRGETQPSLLGLNV